MQLKKATVLLTALLFTFTLHAQNVDQVIKNYIKFIGGKKQWEKVKTITTSGEYDYGGMKFPFTAYAKAPNLYKFIVPLNGKYYAQAFDGTKGWKIDAFKDETTPTLLTGKAALAMANESDVELEDPFINYQSKGHRAMLEGKDTVLNNVCFKVKFIREGGEEETYYFNDKTFQLIMKKAVSKNVEMEGAVLSIAYSDYRDVDGIKIPFKAVSETNGQTILTITIDKAVLNQPIDNKEFQP